jgi:mannose-1-phosphate guanylyltransferase
MSARYVVIMAGGSGTRFWPKSRGHHPKQFLSIGGDEPLLRQTADRVIETVGVERVLVVTGHAHAQHARHQLPELPTENVLVEPEGRNTAPCIAWATHTIQARDPSARIAVLAADHYIADVRGFLSHLDAAFEAAKDRIVLFGIVPTRPETGYGYIRRGPRLDAPVASDLFGVERFVEKPDRKTALEYLADGSYLWNSGMFVFPGALMAKEIERLLPEVHAGILSLMQSPAKIESIYPRLPSVSIDYGVMEKTDRIAVLPASFGWSDVGSWDAAMEIERADENGNVVRGDALVMESKRSMVDAQGGRMVALVGLEDVVVVDTPDAVLVIKRGESQRVKNVVDALKSKGRKGLL